jgi:thymidylate synthase (FAD)
MNIIYYPKVTVISRPQFIEPEHLKVYWMGESSDSERLVEYAGRLCYMSQSNPIGRTTAEYIENIKKQGHGSVLEHSNFSLLLEGISRSCSHELVRHRAGFAYSQLSQRYVDESDTAFVVPPAIIGDVSAETTWKESTESDLKKYIELSNYLYEKYAHISLKVERRKIAREAARSVLPNATETKIVATANARAWRTMLELRCGLGAEREIRRLALEILKTLQKEAPSLFNDFVTENDTASPTYKKV